MTTVTTLRLAPRRGRRHHVSYFGNDAVRDVRAGPEVGRRCARTARADPVVRSSSPSSSTTRSTRDRMADLRRRRRGRHRRRDGRSDQRVRRAARCATTSARSTRRKSKIILVDALDSVLGSFGSKLVQRAAAKQLEHLGVDVWLDEKVIDDRRLPASPSRTRAAPAPAFPPAPSSGRPACKGSSLANSRWPSRPGPRWTAATASRCSDDCTLPGHPEVFVAGDMMSLKGYPGVAQVAMQQGKPTPPRPDQAAGSRDKAAQKGEFHYFDKGSMATISPVQGGRQRGSSSASAASSPGCCGW